MNTYLICIGSNYHRKENILLARRRLQLLFPSICFATEVESEPLYFSNTALFTNQVAIFTTGIGVNEVIWTFKQIEFEAGRRPGDKMEEKVCLDIDLLASDDEILKPEDMQRSYILKGVEELSEEITHISLHVPCLKK